MEIVGLDAGVSAVVALDRHLIAPKEPPLDYRGLRMNIWYWVNSSKNHSLA